ncbi:hypothetical protein ACLKA6_003357 [Drosophila palustris]
MENKHVAGQDSSELEEGTGLACERTRRAAGGFARMHSIQPPLLHFTHPLSFTICVPLCGSNRANAA